MTLAPRIAAALAVAVLAVPAVAQDAEPRKITVTAKKYEFNPSKIELKTGETVEITLQAQDATHGFTCKDLGVDKIVVEKGQSQTFRVTASKPGTYEFKCAKWCGFGHSKMKGEFVVTDAGPSSP